MKKWVVTVSLILSVFLIREALSPRVQIENSTIEVDDSILSEPRSQSQPVQNQVQEEPTEVQEQPSNISTKPQQNVQLPQGQSNFRGNGGGQVSPQPSQLVEDPARAEMLRQVGPNTLVSCQTQIQNCEPRNADAQMENPEQETFCVTFSYNCVSRDSIQRVFNEAEVFVPPPQQPQQFQEQDPQPNQQFQEPEPQNVNPYPENPYNDPSLPGYRQPVDPQQGYQGEQEY